jgi:hypothetical protein
MLESDQIKLEVSNKFNLFSRNDPVQSFFGVKPLEKSEANAIEKLLIENFQIGTLSDGQVNQDADQLKSITSEIKTINKQAILLIGERIYKARNILKSYINGTFMKWIDSTFESRSSAYNILSYYELYLSLPLSAKENLKKIPQKAAYMLASRNGDIEKKAEIISEYHNLKADKMMLLIQEKFPSSKKFLNKDENIKAIHSMQASLKILLSKKDEISVEHKHLLTDLINSIRDLIL